MYIKKADEEKKQIKVAIPLTNTSGKTRIKQRHIMNEYGIPFSSRSNPFNQKCYVEWQIGYDVPIKDREKSALTTITDKTFTGANGKTKYLYELSEYIAYFYKWGIITKDELLEIQDFLQTLPAENYLDRHTDMKIRRRVFEDKEINTFSFLYTVVEYPLAVHQFGQYEILTEIIIKEKQYAVGTQPMLYFCFPVTELDEGASLLGRIAEAKEEATFTFDDNKKAVLLEMLKIFGTLTENHNHDTLAIIKAILEE